MTTEHRSTSAGAALQARLDDWVTIVTGASSGIGAAIARTFAGAGSRVVLVARREERLERLAKAIRGEGGEALIQPKDISRYENVAGVVERALEHWGRIDVMVNNAGNAVAKPLVESSVEEIDLQLDVNLRGVCYGSKAVLPHMLSRKSGNIINIGSICSMRHFPDYATYVAAKFGVLGFSRSLYEEVRESGIRVNCLCPAAVNTEWAELAGAELPWDEDKRLQPDDLAQLALLCCTVPQRVHLEHIVLWPTCEPTV
jgi:NADP-dependent 3-hydroxy acid dehydrogenase YdfG